MADSAELRMSITSIKRVDPYVKEILATATHVALYKFNTSNNEWEKTETEGALFLYSRNGEPFHSIMLMNRLNTDNLIEPIVKEFDYQMQVPFLLYRNSCNKIFGIWFFNKEECIHITYLIETVMEKLKENKTDIEKDKENGVDIFSMLSKAQQDFNKTPTKKETPSQFLASTPRAPDVTSKSVMDFFAKAGSKSTQKPIVGSSEIVLQKLMSNPAHTVEHIEKQQRSVTPQDSSSRQKTPSLSNTSEIKVAENGVSFIRGLSPHLNRLSPPTSGTNLNQHTLDESTDLLGSSPFSQFLDSQKPLLMTPMMFTTPNTTRERLETSTNLNNPDCIDQIDLLTEKQLSQALIYLLRNNANFTKQIHEAYISSIMDKVKSSSSLT